MSKSVDVFCVDGVGFEGRLAPRMTTRLPAKLALCVLSLLVSADVLAGPKKPPPPPPRKPAAAAPAAPAQKPPPPPPASSPAPAPTSPAARRESNDAAAEAAANAARRGPTRVDFDERLLQGQSTKQGAIYLFERKESALRSMLRKRENFRREIGDSIE